jgi:hypothetical protein
MTQMHADKKIKMLPLPICVHLSCYLRAKAFSGSLMRFVPREEILAKLPDLFLQWYGIHGWGVDLGRELSGKKKADRMNRMNRIPLGWPRKFLGLSFSMRAELGRENLEARACTPRRIEF